MSVVQLWLEEHGAAVEVLAAGDRCVSPVALVGDTLIVTTQSAAAMPELAVIDVQRGEERRLTAFGADPTVEVLRCRVPQPDPQLGIELDGWFLRPTGAAGPLPTVLVVHGGPHFTYGEAFSLDAHAQQDLTGGYGERHAGFALAEHLIDSLLHAGAQDIRIGTFAGDVGERGVVQHRIAQGADQARPDRIAHLACCFLRHIEAGVDRQHAGNLEAARDRGAQAEGGNIVLRAGDPLGLRIHVRLRRRGRRGGRGAARGERRCQEESEGLLHAESLGWSH